MEEEKQPMKAKEFFRFLRTLKWPVWMVVIALVLSLVQTAASLAIPLFTRDVIDSFTVESFSMNIVLILVAIFIVQAIAGGISYYFLAYTGEKLVSDLREKMWTHVLHLPVTFYDETETGETMSRITQDTSVLKNLVTDHLVSFITGMVSVVGAVGILFYLDWKMTLIMLLIVPLTMLIILPLGRMMHRVAKATQNELARLSGHLGRTLSEIRLVKSYRAEHAEEKQGNIAIQSLFQYGLKEARIQAFLSPLMTLVMMGMMVFIFSYGGAQVAKGELSAGTLVAIIFLLFQMMMPFMQMARFFTVFQKAIGATERIVAILEMPKEPEVGARPAHAGTLAFEDVHFGYNPEEPILKGVSFQAPMNTVTAFVGPSGAGKTTLFSLIERFYEPDAGKITFGGVDIAHVNMQDWRGKIGYVSQESPLMSGTILDNMTYGLREKPTIEEVQQAAEAANAWEFIEELPAQLQTTIGERGMKLSGGQRQRLAIARALLHDPDILLLDEATSSLDSASEAHVQEALQRLMEGRTTMMIAHRLSTVTHADQLIFIEDGKVTGVGTHKELYNHHEIYRQFAQGQGLS